MKLLYGFIIFIFSHSVFADDVNKPMTNERLDQIIRHLVKDVEGRLGFWSFAIDNVQVQVVTDAKANRMRIMSPIVKSSELKEEQLYRLMQANFDTALDARYAIAKGILWSTYIHPLAELTTEQFTVSLGQTVNSVVTYGSTFSSGLLSFGGGDSQSILRHRLIEELRKKGQEI